MKTLAIFTAALALAATLATAPAAAQNVEKVTTTPPGRILAAAKVKPAATTVYLSGQLASPVAPGSNDWGDTKTQTISILGKIKALLAAHGMTMADVVRMDAYLVAAPGMDGKMDFAGFNAGFAEFFGNAANPTTTTRTTMQVAALAAPPALVELTVIAAK